MPDETREQGKYLGISLSSWERALRDGVLLVGWLLEGYRAVMMMVVVMGFFFFSSSFGMGEYVLHLLSPLPVIASWGLLPLR